MKKKYSYNRPRRTMKRKKCFFCTNKSIPSYKEPDVLMKFVSERGKIIPKLRSGLCNKHQVKLTECVKRARFLAILPFVIRPTS